MTNNTMDTMWVNTAIFWQDGTLYISKVSWQTEGTAGMAEIPSQHQQKPLCVKGVSPNK